MISLEAINLIFISADETLSLPPENQLLLERYTALSDFFSKISGRVFRDAVTKYTEDHQVTLLKIGNEYTITLNNDGIRFLDHTRNFYVSIDKAIKDGKFNVIPELKAMSVTEIMSEVEKALQSLASTIINKLKPQSTNQ